MLSADEIQRMILEAIPGAEVEVRDQTGTGDHFEARVVSPSFRGRTLVEQHQMVYAPLRALIAQNTLHALALKTFSPEQWEKVKQR